MKKSIKKVLSGVVALSIISSAVNCVTINSYASASSNVVVEYQLLSTDGLSKDMTEEERQIYLTQSSIQKQATIGSIKVSINNTDPIEIKGYTVENELYIPIESIATYLDYHFQIIENEYTQALRLSSDYYMKNRTPKMEAETVKDMEVPTLTEQNINVNMKKYFVYNNGTGPLTDVFVYNNSYFIKPSSLEHIFNATHIYDYNNAVNKGNEDTGLPVITQTDKITFSEADGIMYLNKKTVDLMKIYNSIKGIDYKSTLETSLNLPITESSNTLQNNDKQNTTIIETTPVINTTPATNSTVTTTTTTDNTTIDTTNKETEKLEEVSEEVFTGTGAFTSAPTVGEIYANILIDENEPIYISKYSGSVETPDLISSNHSNANMDNFTMPYQDWYGYSNVLTPVGQCTWYARGRFLEVTGTRVNSAKTQINNPASSLAVDDVSVITDINKITFPAIAVYEWHQTFIEYIEYDTNGNPLYIYFSEANVNNTESGQPYRPEIDGQIQKLPFNQFFTRGTNTSASDFLGYIW